MTSLVGKEQAPPGGFLLWDGIKSLVVWKTGTGGLVTLYVLSLVDGPFSGILVHRCALPWGC